MNSANEGILANAGVADQMELSITSTPTPVVNRPVLVGGLRHDFLMLCAIVLVVLTLFAWWWITLPDSWDHPISYILASLVISYEVGVWLTR